MYGIANAKFMAYGRWLLRTIYRWNLYVTLHFKRLLSTENSIILLTFIQARTQGGYAGGRSPPSPLAPNVDKKNLR